MRICWCKVIHRLLMYSFCIVIIYIVYTVYAIVYAVVYAVVYAIVCIIVYIIGNFRNLLLPCYMGMAIAW